VTLHEVAWALNIAKKYLLMHLVRYASDLMLVIESAKTDWNKNTLSSRRKPDSVVAHQTVHALEAATGNAQSPGLIDELAVVSTRGQTADNNHQHQHQAVLGKNAEPKPDTFWNSQPV